MSNRWLLVVAALTAVASCGDDGASTSPPPAADSGAPAPTPPGTPPAPPAPTPPGTPPAPPPPPPPAPIPGTEQTITIDAPGFELQPYEEKTVCFYTTITTDRELGIRAWQSTMSEGSHHLIMFFTREAARPDGTLEECGLGGLFSPASLGGVPIWAYAAQEPESEIVFPDGVGYPIRTEQHLFLQMHYLNPTGEVMRPSIRVVGSSYPEGTEYQRAGVYATFNTQIEVPPGETGSVAATCEVSPDLNFFLLTTHSHQFTTAVRVYDGPNMVLETLDWEHPAVDSHDPEPFHFSSGTVRYECQYQNPTRSWVRTGDSAETDEMCMAVGYYWPARGMRFCLDERVFSL